MVDPVATGIANALNVQLRINGKESAVKRRPVPAGANAPYLLPKLVLIARDLAKLGPPIDAVKIARVRQAIADGHYTVDPKKIADSMVNYYQPSETP
jgi:flagellar biosynthesis anti-sigma factor FlgM